MSIRATCLPAIAVVLGLSACGSGGSCVPDGQQNAAGGSPIHSPPAPAQPKSRACRRPDDASAPLSATAPTTLSFWDGHHGLMGTGWGRFGGVIYRTSDGGNTFRRVKDTCPPLSWLDTAGKRDAWATTDLGAAHQLLHSGDGGTTWRALPNTNAEMPSFATPTEGMAIDGPRLRQFGLDSTKAVATSDGGRNWDPITAPCPEGLVDSGYAGGLPYAGAAISMGKPGIAWAICVQNAEQQSQPKGLYQTQDGGQTWDEVLAPAGAEISEAGGTGQISFDTTGEGVLTADHLYSTSDCGSSWELATAPVEGRPASRPLRGVDFIQQLSASQLFALAGRDLLGSTNGGSSWKVLYEFPSH